MPSGSIELVNVTKEYQVCGTRKTAVNNVSLTIRQGEFVGLVGMNGSGKSTLARLINGLIRPTGGRVIVNGLDTGDNNSLQAIRSHVGMVFQNPDNQLISAIVEEDVAFGPENLRLPAKEVQARVDWALQAVGLVELRHHAPHLLSGGQKQKVAIASALAMRPDHLILDEPTSMLDPAGRQELLETLTILNKQYNITVVLISHYMEDMVRANRLLVLDHGAILLDGVPGQLFAAPEELARVGFAPPGIVRLVNNLRAGGYEIDQGIDTVQELVETICQLSR
ncbi:Energy-coupling factor transporter ATP-binding protein EcfA1 [Sporomusa ovata DSM 2662]|uniref:ATPase component of general energizing module of ECF transporters n=1 Tax=Sporomusa ovata TaxID=2378 RepID=A0A0U1KRS3_9FIRM|nr:energy-coupling factor transporter ATPase [Sporomusa ovata]EQB24911.1 ABC-type cobalt transport system, ATPase component [Sporomusa ovata DSM 2662]CQR70107.1 ATPase component of general energizing module of ECF transporters [Sporomusa ovata]